MTDRTGMIWLCGAKVVLAAALVLLPISGAGAYTRTVEDSCKNDYFRFCSAYSVGSSALRSCMESNARNISRRCVEAMVKEGIIDPRRVRR